MNANSLRSLAEAVLEMEKKATAGPWVWDNRWLWNSAKRPDMVLYYTIDDDGVHATPGDAAFIASTRTSAPQLARAVIALLAVCECARQVRDGLVTGETEDLLARSGLDAALKEIGV